MDNPLARMMMQKKPKEVKEKVVEKKNQPWIEKYRPKKIDDVVYQEEIVLVLKKSLSNIANDFPNLLFYGPPGTGKTSTILALAHELFGDSFSQRVLELNASDERGINVVREKIKKFAKQTIAVSNNKPQFKLIILDEADSMTDSAQSALRRIMELESKSTRFCLICNYITRIIEPIASRCAKFRFNILDQECVIDKLQNISDLEGIQIENRDVLVELCKLSGGDLRKAINILQTALKMKKNEEKVTIDDLHEICGHIPPKLINNIIDVCKEKSFQKLDKAIKDLIYEGYSAHQLLIQLNDWIEDEKCFLKDKKKSAFAEKISKADQFLLEGSNEYLQSLNVCSTLISLV